MRINRKWTKWIDMRIPMLGNSFTFTNEMPQKLAEVKNGRL